jgi:hypothetical protein
VGVLPVLGMVALLMLFAWPGLEFSWVINHRWRFTRIIKRHSPGEKNVKTEFEVDSVVLRVGPVGIQRLRFTWKDPLLFDPGFPKGFQWVGGIGKGAVGFDLRDDNTAVEFAIQWHTR